MYLEIKDLCFSHYKKPLCLKDVSFSLQKGNHALILARKDEGKTTLLKVLSGFETTYFGKIFLNGKEIRDIPNEEKNFSLLPSEPVLLNNKSLKYNIDFLCDTCKIDKLEEEKIRELLKLFKIDKEPKVKIKKLSLCEKRKLAMLRSYIKCSDIIFLDDQFVDLLEEEQKDIEEIYKILFNNRNTTIICTAQPDTFISKQEFFCEMKVDFVGYLNLSILTKFNNINDFKNSFLDRDIFEFLDGFIKNEGHIKNQNQEYFFITDKNKYIKFDNNFNITLNKIGLQNEDIERVELFCKNDIVLEEIKDKDFNTYIRENKIFIYLKFDGTKVI